MAFDPSQALSAIAYGGNGYYQGFNSAQDNNYRHAMQQMQAQDASYDMQQKRQLAQRQQALSDDAMRLFNPQVPTPGGQPQNQPQQPGANQGGVAQSPDDFANKFSTMANDAFARGDLSGGGQALSMATNLRSEQAAQAQKQSAIQSANLKRQVGELQYVAQVFSGTRDNPSAFYAAQMQILSNPDISQEERQNVAQFKYSPQMVDFIQQHGLTAAQQKQDQLRQLQLQQTQAHNEFTEQNESARTSLQRARLRMEQQKSATSGKVGAVKVPTANDLNNATQATKDVMGPDVDTDSEDFKNAQQAIASRGLQLMSQNRGLNASQAFAQAAQEAKASGELTTVSVPAKYKQILGVNIPGTKTDATNKTTFKEKGDTKQTAIPLQPGAKEGDLVDGKYYVNAKGVTAQYKDGKFIPVQ